MLSLSFLAWVSLCLIPRLLRELEVKVLGDRPDLVCQVLEPLPVLDLWDVVSDSFDHRIFPLIQPLRQSSVLLIYDFPILLACQTLHESVLELLYPLPDWLLRVQIALVRSGDGRSNECAGGHQLGPLLGVEFHVCFIVPSGIIVALLLCSREVCVVLCSLVELVDCWRGWSDLKVETWLIGVDIWPDLTVDVRL